MKRLFWLFLLVLLPLCGYSQEDQDWNMMGKIYVHTISSNNEYVDGPSKLAFLYGKFDGNQMTFKIFVTADNRSYVVVRNPDYNKAKVDFCDEQSRKNKYFKGPWPKTKEKYPQKAGRYYLDSVQVF